MRVEFAISEKKKELARRYEKFDRKSSSTPTTKKANPDLLKSHKVFSYYRTDSNRSHVSLKDKFIQALVEYADDSGKMSEIEVEAEELANSENLTLYADCFIFMSQIPKILEKTNDNVVEVQLDYKFRHVYKDVCKSDIFIGYIFDVKHQPILDEPLILEVIRLED